MSPLRSLRLALALAALGLVAGCRWPWEPESPVISGEVRYANGHRANLAEVSIPHDTATFTDWGGRYTLQSGGGEGDTVLVYARDFCRGACASTTWGVTRVVLHGQRMVVNIVLDKDDPI